MDIQLVKITHDTRKSFEKIILDLKFNLNLDRVRSVCLPDSNFNPFLMNVLGKISDREKLESSLEKSGHNYRFFDENNNSLLALACSFPDPVMATILLDYFAANHKNNNSQTALMVSSVFGNPKVTSLLLNHPTNSSDVNARDTNRFSSLTYALAEIPLLYETVKLFPQKETLVHSTYNNAVACANLLLDAGAGVSQFELDHMVPYQKSHPALFERLQNRMRPAKAPLVLGGP